MKNYFTRTGFDSLLNSACTINGGVLTIAAGQTLVLDGTFTGTDVVKAGEDVVDRTKLIVGGHMKAEMVKIPNVTVTGKLECDLLIVEGVFAVKANAVVKVKEIRYRLLMIETGAVVMAQVHHLDHISAGEET